MSLGFSNIIKNQRYHNLRKYICYKNIPLNESNTAKIKLLNKNFISSDTFIADYLGDREIYIPAGMHISINSNIINKETGKFYSRRYTPISLSDKKSNIIKLLIKVYKPVENVFPLGGLVSQYIDKSDVLDVEYPYGKIVYRGFGGFGFREKREKKPTNDYNDWPIRKFKRFIMIAGGTGITPLYLLLLSILKENNSELEMDLIYASKSEKDVYLYNELNDITNKINLKVQYFIEKPSERNENLVETSKLRIGLIRKSDLLKYEMYHDSEETLVLVCGSKQMSNYYIKPIFEEMRFKSENICIF